MEMGKSSEKHSGEVDSSGSMSKVHLEKFSDNQEVSKSSSMDAESLEKVSSNVGIDGHDVERSLREKLASALLNIRAKENLVKQHAKVAEEAVCGWEKAETEVASLKQQLETSMQKNSAMEDRINQLDFALKECVRQLRLAKEEQEQKIQDVVLAKVKEWETEKFELESHVIELESQLKSSKAEASVAMNEELVLQLEGIEKENFALKVELHTLSDKLRILSIECEFSNQAAETASKQHLESIKKVAKLEAECRRLRSATRKFQLSNDHKSLTNVYVESLTDSQSDSGERMLTLDNEPSCSDSWASALIAELDQFKSDKSAEKNISASPVEIDLMDDFLEMERLASLPAPNQSSTVVDVASNQEEGLLENSKLKAELERMVERITELQEKLEKTEREREEISIILTETQERLSVSIRLLKEEEKKALELQRQLDSTYASKKNSDVAAEEAEAKRKVMETQLSIMNSQTHELHQKACILETELEMEKTLAEKLAVKCHRLEHELERMNRKTDFLRVLSSNGELKITQERQLAAAGKLAECQQTIASLGLQLKSLASIDDLVLDTENIQNGGSPLSTCEPVKWVQEDSVDVTSHPVAPAAGTNSQSLKSSSSSVSYLKGYSRPLS